MASESNPTLPDEWLRPSTPDVGDVEEEGTQNNGVEGDSGDDGEGTGAVELTALGMLKEKAKVRFGEVIMEQFEEEEEQEDEDESNENWVQINYGTLEAVPDTVQYRTTQSSDVQRPTLTHLLARKENEEDVGEASRTRQRGISVSDVLAGNAEEEEEFEVEEEPKTDAAKPTRKKFGTWDGVFIRCLLNIFGVIMFLRLGWVVGNAGVGLTSVIVLLSTCVTTVTTLSLSAITTNGEVKGGGAYFMISRSLGPEFGGAIGITFFLANAVAVALYIVGFAEAVQGVDPEYELTSGGSFDLRVWGLLAVTCLFVLALVGVDWVIKTERGLIALLGLSILIFMIGTGTTSSDADKGISGYDGDVFEENWSADFQQGETFFTVLAVFFPAVTGIMAGANISGDLQDPAKNIPQGTLLSILLSTIVYLILAWMIGGVATRTATEEDGGLYENFLIMKDIAAWPPLVFAGIFAATISSALTSLVGAPRILQAVARDKLFPPLQRFGEGRGSKDEPIPAYILTFVIACVCILIGDLNAIAPVITNFFMVSYALINYACFSASISKSPGWRPSFKYYHPYVSLVGSLLSVVIMVLSNWVQAIITIFIGACIYKYLDYIKPNVNWGESSSALKYIQALRSIIRLDTMKFHIKNFRPQYLVFSGRPETRRSLIDFVSFLDKGNGVTVCGQVIVDDGDAKPGETYAHYAEAVQNTYLKKNKLKAFLDVVVAPSFRTGALSLLQLCGIGKLRPNTAVLGFKTRWMQSHEWADNYVSVLRDCFMMHYGVVVVRGLEFLTATLLPQGTIDVYWLVDDGGLTILLPYLLKQNEKWKNYKIRVLTMTSKKELSKEQARLAKLLRKFRIDAETEALVVPNRTKPSKASLDRFRDLMHMGPDVEIEERTKRFLRFGEIIRANSTNSNLVIIPLPVPKHDCNPEQYMSWLECMSSDNPATILMRGNQESVITMYS